MHPDIPLKTLLLALQNDIDHLYEAGLAPLAQWLEPKDAVPLEVVKSLFSPKENMQAMLYRFMLVPGVDPKWREQGRLLLAEFVGEDINFSRASDAMFDMLTRP